MRKFVLAAATGVLTGAVATTQIVGPLLAQESSRQSSVYEQLDLFGDIFERIRSQYVEEVDEADLIEAAINGMLTSLDPHSSYPIAPDDAELTCVCKHAVNLWRAGDRSHTGRRLCQRWSRRSTTPPRMEAGIEAGDFITHVDGASGAGPERWTRPST